MIGYFSNAHHAVVAAARRWVQALGGVCRAVDGPGGCDVFLSEAGHIGLELAARSFRIFRRDGILFVAGDRPRSVLAGTDYWLHHRTRRCSLPIERSSPFSERLVMEDFPFMCYQPTGFDFDLDAYAANLAVLGFSAMECNRFSRMQPMGPRHWNYAFTNPSPAAFVWTSRHEGVFDRQVIEANAAELDRTIQAAREYDLDPTLTSFLPRPYPGSFFTRHPDWRGPAFRNRFMRESGHEPVYALDTDHPEVQAFYREIYGRLFDRYPDLGHLFFWHADLGTQFWADGEGPRALRRVDRVAGFHRMLGALLRERGMTTRVWLNPWGLAKDCLEDLHEALPAHVGFSIKDNPGLEVFAGTTPIVLGDATIITATLGAIPQKILSLAGTGKREVCIGQYQDFSEDLDPLLGVPHPIMTFRKFRTLLQAGQTGASAVHWGLLSPDRVPINLNQDVIREMQWGTPARVFSDLLERLVPPSFDAVAREQIHTAWRRVDQALQCWPQFWGLRLQDSGVRLRWLVRPFGFGMQRLTRQDKAYYLENQLYALDNNDPLGAFMQIHVSQARETAVLYGDMTALLDEAVALLEALDTPAHQAGGNSWIRKQSASLATLRHCWTTYQHLFGFHGHRLQAEEGDEVAMEKCRQHVNHELENLAAMRAHLARHPDTLVVAGRSWGQCFGPDLDDHLARKAKLMCGLRDAAP